jgi:hypothetical protein
MSVPQIRDDVADFLEEMHAQDNGGRLIFGIDATASRQPTWDMAARLQSEMFAEAAKIGGLRVQLVYYRGTDECRASRWTENARELTDLMVRIHCHAGETQVRKILDHIRKENRIEKVHAAVFIGDAVEEPPHELYDAAAGLGVPIFWFQEGNGLAFYLDQRGELVHPHPPQTVEQIFRELARLSNGAYARFNAGAAVEQLRQLLRAIAAFAAGGRKALSDLNTGAARKLLGQLK